MSESITHVGDIELAIAHHYGWRNNIIVPNVYYGLGFSYEVDLLVVRKSGWAYEIEIKTNRADLIADLRKRHKHRNHRIKLLYFAVPIALRADALELIPAKAGLFVVDRSRSWVRQAQIEKTPEVNRSARKLTTEEIQTLWRLSSLRIWSLKEANYVLRRKLDRLKQNVSEAD